MTAVTPDVLEAAVEKAAPAMYEAIMDKPWEQASAMDREGFTVEAVAGMGAAYPLIAAHHEAKGKAAGWDEGWAACRDYRNTHEEWEDNYDEGLLVDDVLEGWRDDNPPAPKAPTNPHRGDS